MKKAIKLKKAISLFAIPLWLVAITLIFTALGAAELWQPMFEDGANTFFQWFSLVLYRIILYIIPAIILCIGSLRKETKFGELFLYWLNWQCFVYLLWKAIITVVAIDIAFNMEILSSIDGVVLLFGYVFTFFKKKEIEFGKLNNQLTIDN